MTFTKTLAGILTAATVCVAGIANALTVDNVSGTWINATANGTVTGNGTTQLRWGTPANQTNQSGYNFLASGNIPFDAAPNTQFVLGEFQHLNFPVTGDRLESADLVVSLGFANAPTIETVFSFTHHETNNITPTCPYDGGVNGVGLNSEGCADRVTVNLDLDASKSLLIDGEEFFLDFEAFRLNGERQSSFVTAENANNSAFILASFRTAGDVAVVDGPTGPVTGPTTPGPTNGPTPVPSPVPLPASLPLMAIGLGAIGLLARRRRK